ncbi:hypothetical protein Tco_1084183 [Tanacetum coccineum]
MLAVSQPSGYTKKDKIRQTPVHSKLNANSELKCVKCNGCMLSDNHDLCVLDFINNVNARKKTKSVNKSSKRKVWKPTGKVIITTTEVPLKKPTALENETTKPVVTLVYSRKLRKSKTNVPVSKSKVIQIVLWYLDSGCSKHMTGDRSQLTNFVNKFLGTVKFRNDHVAKILGYSDYQIRNVMISRVYYLFVSLYGQSSCYRHVTLKIVPSYTLSWGKTPYELLHDKPPDLSFFHVFGALCYPTNDSENLGKLQPKADIDFDELTAMASEHSSSGPALHEMTSATISSGLMPNPYPLTPFVPPSRTYWDILFQLMFDELLTPPPSVDLPVPEVIARIDEVVAPVPAVSN